MAEYIELGPFDATIFLVPPTTPPNPATGGVLAVEQFQLLHEIHSEIGLDHIHGDRVVDSQALLNGDGLKWRGKVLFSTADRNKKQISTAGLGLLSTAAQRNGLRLDWSKGFQVILEAPYWRHCFIRPSPNKHRFHDPISCDLFVDLKPVIVENPSRSTSRLIQRRFSIATMSTIFMKHSAKTISQSGLILTLDHIRLVKGKHTKARNLTVKWYCDRYKELFPTSPGSEDVDVPPTHQGRTNSRSFYSALASHLDSPTFCQDLVVHKKVLSKHALAKFRRDVETVGTFPPEEHETIVIEDSPSPPYIVEDEGQEWPQEQMDLDQLTIIEDDPLEVQDDEEDEPMAWWSAAEETAILSDATSTAIDTRSSTVAVSSMGDPKSASLDPETRRLMLTIPKCMFDHPTLPDDCQWVCPVEGCFALFDLKGKLSRNVLALLTPQEIDLLTSRAFTSKSQKASSIFSVLVDFHYGEHLSQLGIVTDKEKMFRQI